MSRTVLSNEILRLRPIKEEDLEFLRILRNKNREYFFDQKYITRNAQRKWWSKYKSNKHDEMFIIEHINNEVEIGTIALYNITHVGADLGRIIIAKRYRNNGFAKQAIELLLNHAFVDHKLKFVKVSVYSKNKIAINLYQHIGFILEEPLTISLIKYSNGGKHGKFKKKNNPA